LHLDLGIQREGVACLVITLHTLPGKIKKSK
jgi:hypothetical protein